MVCPYGNRVRETRGSRIRVRHEKYAARRDLNRAPSLTALTSVVQSVVVISDGEDRPDFSTKAKRENHYGPNRRRCARRPGPSPRPFPHLVLPVCFDLKILLHNVQKPIEQLYVYFYAQTLRYRTLLQHVIRQRRFVHTDILCQK